MGFYYQKQQIIWSSQLHLRVKFRVSRIVRYFWLFCLALGLSWFRYPNIFGILFQSLRATLHHTLFPVSMTTAWYKNSMHHCCCPPLTCMGLALPALPEINRNLIMFFFWFVQRNLSVVGSRWMSVRESAHVVTKSILFALPLSSLPRI